MGPQKHEDDSQPCDHRHKERQEDEPVTDSVERPLTQVRALLTRATVTRALHVPVLPAGVTFLYSAEQARVTRRDRAVSDRENHCSAADKKTAQPPGDLHETHDGETAMMFGARAFLRGHSLEYGRNPETRFEEPRMNCGCDEETSADDHEDDADSLLRMRSHALSIPAHADARTAATRTMSAA